MTGTMLVFIVAAIVLNILMYGGIAGVYFRDKHRPDLPSRVTASEHAVSSPFTAVRNDAERVRLDIAA